MHTPGPSNSIVFNCGHCGTKLEVPANLAGVTGPCPSCHASITAPHPAPPEPDLLSFFAEDSAPARPITTPQPPHQNPQYASVPPSPMEAPVQRQPMPEQAHHAEAPTSHGGRSATSGVRRASPPPQYQQEDGEEGEPARSGLLAKLIVGLLALALIGVGAFAFSPQFRQLVLKARGKQEVVLPGKAANKLPPPGTDEAQPPETTPIQPPKTEATANTGPKKEEPIPPLEETPTPALLTEPRGFLENYLKQTKWESLVVLSIKGEELRPRMAAYYKDHPYTPEKVQDIAFSHKQSLPDSKHQFYLFRVVTEANKGSFPMVAEETDAGLKADWLSFVQFKDKLLANFMDKPVFTERPQTFSAMLQRSHYFVNDVPDRDQKDAFALLEPDDSNEAAGWAFVPKFSNLCRDLEKQVEWNKSYFPILELQWMKEEKYPNQPYVRLMGVKQYNWRWYDPSFEEVQPGGGQEKESISAPKIKLETDEDPGRTELVEKRDNSLAPAEKAAPAPKPATPKPSSTKPSGSKPSSTKGGGTSASRPAEKKSR